MGVVRNASGHSVYMPAPKIDVSHPEDFFSDDPDEYRERVAEARYRIIEAIRFFERPLYGRGLNNEVHGLSRDVGELANFIDFIDGKRARRVQKQRMREVLYSLAPGERRLRSPQDIKRRRSAIFSGEDFPRGFFKDIAINQIEFASLVDKVRRSIIEAAITMMWSELEIEHTNDVWSVKMSVLDQHIASRRHRANRVKDDIRPFHGNPNRDRKRQRFTT